MNIKAQKAYPVLENLEIIDTGSEGQGIARWNNMVVFIPGAVPGDIVDIHVTRKKANYREGRIFNFQIKSPNRVHPNCEHFGICGGCKWQNMAYETQLFYKEKQVQEALTRIAKLELPAIEKIKPSKNIFYYRNKLEFTFSNKMWLTKEEIGSGNSFGNRDALGFHIPKMFDKVLDINHCHLQRDPSNSIRKEIKEFSLENKYEFFDLRNQQGFLRNLIIRTGNTGDLMVIVSFFRKDEEKMNQLLEHISGKFPEISSLMYIINPKKNDSISDLPVHPFAGKDHILEEMEGLKFKIGPKSFFQTNSEQAYELYKITREFAAIKENETVYDLYTGTGTIANFIAGKAKKVIGIEYIPEAIADAHVNSTINNITNTTFFSGDIKDVLNDEFIATNGKPHVIITDPPRAGMHEDISRKINEIRPERIVYVSCNPSTQARDLVIFDPYYRVTQVQPIDMFPHTHHVENVVLLEKK